MNLDLPKVGEVYRHYKRGGTYEIIGVARHTETEELLIVYKALYADEQSPLGQLWVRPADMFLAEIKPNVTRFSKVI